MQNPDEQEQENGQEQGQDTSQDQQEATSAPPGATSAPPVVGGGPAGAQHVQSPAQAQGTGQMETPKAKPASHLDQDEQFLAILAAIIFSRPTIHTTKDALQNAKNLVQAIADEANAAAAAEEEPEAEAA